MVKEPAAAAARCSTDAAEAVQHTSAATHHMSEVLICQFVKLSVQCSASVHPDEPLPGHAQLQVLGSVQWDTHVICAMLP
jgi:hypothetical protein